MNARRWVVTVGVAVGLAGAAPAAPRPQGETPSAVARAILLGGADATFADLAGNKEFQAACAAAGMTHLGGPMLGGLRSDGALVWLRTLQPAKVEVIVTTDEGEKRVGPVASGAASDLTAVVPVTGLAANTSYRYRVLVDGKPITMPESARLTTAPTEKQQTRIAFSSCAHTGGFSNGPLLAAMRARQVHAFLTNGDTIAHDSGRHRGKQRAGYLTRDGYPAWRELVASVPVFATWDDHDYFGNDLAGVPPGFTPEDQLRTWEVFRHNWTNPSYGFGDERRGVFLRTRIGPADVLMLDNRYFRDPATKAGLLGPDQMKWVEEQLLDCKGPFIVLSCGTMWSDYISAGKDSWGKHDQAGRERLFRFIEEHRIAGVLLISGDRHGASGWKIPRPSGFSFYEFGVANLGPSGDHSRSVASHPTDALFCTGRDPVSKGNHFGMFTFDPTPTDPTVTFNLVAADGKSEYDLVLKRSQLTPPAAVAQPILPEGADVTFGDLADKKEFQEAAAGMTHLGGCPGAARARGRMMK